MFIHSKTGKTYYSIKDKIKYYSKKAYNDKSVTKEEKAYAIKRLGELKALDKRDFSEPTMIVTNDVLFGNATDKPRGAVVLGVDKKNKLIVSPVLKRNVKAVVLDNDLERQVDGRERKIERRDIYEVKYIDGLATLSDQDIKRLKVIRCKKITAAY